jgi:cell division protein FtsB
MTRTHAPALGERIAAFAPTIPNYVWLAMLLLAATLLALSTLVRAGGQAAQARNAHADTQSRLIQAQTANSELKNQTRQLRQNPRAAAQAAQAQLHYVKRNEIVVGLR